MSNPKTSMIRPQEQTTLGIAPTTGRVLTLAMSNPLAMISPPKAARVTSHLSPVWY